MPLGIEWTIKVSDPLIAFLTSLTIGVSVVAVLLWLAKDRDTKTTEQDNRVR